MRERPHGVSMHHWILTVLTVTLLVTATPGWSGEPAPQQIIPGVGIGPARLGMVESQARRVLVMAGLDQPWCSVDILARGGRVIALGTSFGGCLELTLQSSTVRLKVIKGVALPEVPGIGGSSHPLIRAFGTPTRFTLVAPVNVLLWRNGLVARTAVVKDDESITYLAVVSPGATAPPYALLSAAP